MNRESEGEPEPDTYENRADKDQRKEQDDFSQGRFT
jgi:hypothetical protein